MMSTAMRMTLMMMLVTGTIMVMRAAQITLMAMAVMMINKMMDKDRDETSEQNHIIL